MFKENYVILLNRALYIYNNDFNIKQSKPLSVSIRSSILNVGLLRKKM